MIRRMNLRLGTTCLNTSWIHLFVLRVVPDIFEQKLTLEGKGVTDLQNGCNLPICSVESEVEMWFLGGWERGGVSR